MAIHHHNLNTYSIVIAIHENPSVHILFEIERYIAWT